MFFGKKGIFFLYLTSNKPSFSNFFFLFSNNFNKALSPFTSI